MTQVLTANIMSKITVIPYGKRERSFLEAPPRRASPLETESQVSRLPLSILVVGQPLFVREKLMSLVSAGIQVQRLADCAAVAEAIKIASLRPVGCAIIELVRNDEPWPPLRDRLKALSHLTRSLALLDTTSPLEMAPFMDIGLAAVLPCTLDSSVLLKVIRNVISDGTWPLDGINNAQPSARFTPRQITVLHLLYEGLSNKEIAGYIGVSDSSVKCTIQQLFRKLGARSRAQLIRVVLESSPELLTIHKGVAVQPVAVSAR